MPLDPADELPRVTPAMLRRGRNACPRRLHHDFTSGRKLSPVGDGPFEVANRLTADAITWHRVAGVAAEHAFPEPTDLEPEQRHLYRAAASTYVRTFGDAPVEVHDLGWSTDLPDAGVQLVSPPGITVTGPDGPEMRVLRIGASRGLLDDVDLRCIVLRAHAWSPEALRVVAVDLLDGQTAEYAIDMTARLGAAEDWLLERVALIRDRADRSRAVLGSDCRLCPCIPGCPELTRADA